MINCFQVFALNTQLRPFSLAEESLARAAAERRADAATLHLAGANRRAGVGPGRYYPPRHETQTHF